MGDLSLFNLDGKTALVTGAATGIGRACAFALARAGANVAIVDRNRAQGEGTAASIGGSTIFVHCDVADGEQVADMVRTVAAHYGRLDIAVNNAGIFLAEDDESQSQENWEQVIGVNLTGTWLCAKAEMQQMKRQNPVEGKVINIASIASIIACSNGSYDASKAGIVHLTRTLAARWGRYNINVNCLSPGYVISGMGTPRSLEERERLREVTPLGHVQRLDEMDGAVVFLASRASDFMTGQNLVIDGGHTLGTWLAPLERTYPPRVDSAMEAAEMKRDLAARNIAHDQDGIALPGD